MVERWRRRLGEMEEGEAERARKLRRRAEQLKRLLAASELRHGKVCLVNDTSMMRGDL